MAATEPFKVLPQQVFVPCQVYNWSPLATFIVEQVTATQAYVVIPTGGGHYHPNGRHRWVSLKSLHPTGKTAQGKERQTGYRLHTDVPDIPDPWLCGSCLRYFDREGLAVAAYGPASSTCRGCMAQIDETFPLPTSSTSDQKD